MANYIKQSDVSDGMVGNLPWGKPIKIWSKEMLKRAIGAGHVEDAPATRAAILRELNRRR